MEGLLILCLVVLALALLDGVAIRWGVDSRDGSRRSR